MAKTLGRLELSSDPPDVAILLKEEPRMKNDGRTAYLNSVYAVDAQLLYWGANWSKITESAISRCNVKLVLDPDRLPTGDSSSLRSEIGRLLHDAGCVCARQDGDPDGLRVFRVPGKGNVGWMFWNGSEKPMHANRGGREIAIAPRSATYVQVSDGGQIESCENF